MKFTDQNVSYKHTEEGSFFKTPHQNKLNTSNLNASRLNASKLNRSKMNKT